MPSAVPPPVTGALVVTSQNMLILRRWGRDGQKDLVTGKQGLTMGGKEWNIITNAVHV